VGGGERFDMGGNDYGRRGGVEVVGKKCKKHGGGGGGKKGGSRG